MEALWTCVSSLHNTHANLLHIILVLVHMVPDWTLEEAFVKLISQCDASHIVRFATLLLGEQMKSEVNVVTYFIDGFCCALVFVFKTYIDNQPFLITLVLIVKVLSVLYFLNLSCKLLHHLKKWFMSL